MKNIDAKEHGKLYRRNIFLFIVITFPIMTIAAVVLALYYEFVYAAATVVVWPYCYTIFSSFMYKRHIMCYPDARSHREALEAAKLYGKGCYHLIRAMRWDSDYQSAINLCVCLLKGKSSISKRANQLLFLANSYFELGDIESLRSVCEYYSSFMSSCSEKQRRKCHNDNYYIIKYYTAFLEEDYRSCQRIYEYDLGDLNLVKRDKETLLALNYWQYRYGVACYNNGDVEKAREIFERVCAEVPGYSYSLLSRKYLDAIENGVEYKCEESKILPDENFVLPDFGGTAIENFVFSEWCMRIWWGLCVVAILCVFVDLGVGVYKDIKGIPGAVSLSKHEIAISEIKETDDFEILEAVSLECEGAEAFNYCIYTVDEYDVQVLIYYTDAESYYYWEHDIIEDLDWQGNICYSDFGYYLGYEILKEENSEYVDEYMSIEVDTVHGTFYFYINVQKGDIID